jgi:ArsR family transcriptional regulator, virulence genes transcriptional regulator
MHQAPADLATFERNAMDVAVLLRALANERRLMILCKLVEWGEGSVGALADAVGLSQSALSQHLSRMRAEHLIAPRRDGTTIWYRIADQRIETLLGLLQHLYCAPSAPTKRKRKPTGA